MRHGLNEGAKMLLKRIGNTLAMGLAIGALPQAALAREYLSPTLTWMCPEKRVDGAAFSCAQDAYGVDIEVQVPTTATPAPAPVIRELPGTALSHPVANDAAGTRYRVRYCDKFGLCAEWSAYSKKPGKPGRATAKIEGI